MSVEARVLSDHKGITQFSKSHNEPAWFLEHRLEALKQAGQLPLPKLEKTNIDRWNFTEFQPFIEEEAIADITLLPKEIGQYLTTGEVEHFLVQKNASVIYEQGLEALAKQGVTFKPFSTILQEDCDVFRKWFLKMSIERPANKLTALHAAYQSGGFYLHVPKGVELKVPLHSLCWITGEKAAALPRILIIAEENSRVDVVTHFVSEADDHAALLSGLVDVVVGANAEVRVATVNHLGAGTVDVLHRQSHVDRDGKLEWIMADLSEGNILSDNAVHLHGVGGNVTVQSVHLGVGEAKSNITSSIHHWGQHTASDIQARSVMKDAATSILNSITKIEKGASKSDGQQTGKVLMMTPEARGDANPILLIDENDVTAGHAASVGRVDPLQMYYLMSRGISKTEAEKLIIRGFLDTVISQIPSSSLREAIYQVIEGKWRA